jgi:hypothetical protein
MELLVATPRDASDVVAGLRGDFRPGDAPEGARFGSGGAVDDSDAVTVAESGGAVDDSDVGTVAESTGATRACGFDVGVVAADGLGVFLATGDGRIVAAGGLGGLLPLGEGLILTGLSVPGPYNALSTALLGLNGLEGETLASCSAGCACQEPTLFRADSFRTPKISDGDRLISFSSSGLTAAEG